MVVLALALLAAPVLGLMALTGLGERKRGARAGTAVVAGVFFPVTWAAWYVCDEHPYAASHRRSGSIAAATPVGPSGSGAGPSEVEERA